MLNLMPYLKILLPLLVPSGAGAGREAARECDPLSHPALQRMSLEELADLPFDRGSCPLQPTVPAVQARRR